MARLDSFNDSVKWRQRLTGPFASVAKRGESAARTLPRDEPKRTVLQEIGERPERIGPPVPADQADAAESAPTNTR